MYLLFSANFDLDQSRNNLLMSGIMQSTEENKIHEKSAPITFFYSLLHQILIENTVEPPGTTQTCTACTIYEQVWHFLRLNALA